jgi:hypothetical protein
MDQGSLCGTGAHATPGELLLDFEYLLGKRPDP